MRRILALAIIGTLLVGGCTWSRATPSPSSPKPVLQNPVPGGVGASGLQAELPGGLQAVISKAPAGALQQVSLKANQPVSRPGIYFMSVASGDIEGWVSGDDPNRPPSFDASPDSRWIHAQDQTISYLADRRAPGNVFQWAPNTARLVAAHGSTVLFATESHFWIANDGLSKFTSIDIRPDSNPRSVIAPDGRALLLVNGQNVYRIGLPQGEVKPVGTITAASSSSLMPIRQGLEVVVSTTTSSGQPFYRPTTSIQRFDWTGKRISNQTVPDLLSFSPDGTMVTWHESLLDGIDRPLVVGNASDFSPKFRLNGENPCTLGPGGYPWLADGSGQIVFTTLGYRLLSIDGILSAPPYLAGTTWIARPVPAPDRTDRFAIGGTKVVDATGKTLAVAVLGTGISSSSIPPWGESSSEVRFSPRFGGKGYSCGPTIFPPTVERAPFAPVAGMQVKVVAGDCVNLRREAVRTAPVIRCLPDGARLKVAMPPGTNNKGELRRDGNPLGTNMGGELWWYARTENGESGWVLLSADYLAWLPPVVGSTSDPVADLINDETENMLYWLRAPALSLQDSVWGLTQWCKQAGPGYIRLTQGFDPERHGAGSKTLESTCTALRSAIDTVKPFDDGGSWQQKVIEITNDLIRQSGTKG